jgi:hypothetical protein
MSDDTPEQPSAIGEFAMHEILHTAYVVMDTFEHHILEREDVAEHPELAHAAEVVHQAMFDFYQLVGRLRSADGASPTGGPLGPGMPS